MSVAGYTKDSLKWGSDNMSASTLIFNVHDSDANTFRYTDLDTINSAMTGEKVYVADTNFNELEVVYVKDYSIQAQTSDYKVALVVSKSEVDNQETTFSLNDGTTAFEVSTDENVTCSGDDPDTIAPNTFVKYRVNSNNKLTYIEAPEANEALFAGLDTDVDTLVSHVDTARGYISVGADAYTEYVGESPVVFDISDYYNIPDNTVEEVDKEARSIELGDVVCDKMYVKAYKITIDDNDEYFVLVTRNTDTDGIED